MHAMTKSALGRALLVLAFGFSAAAVAGEGPPAPVTDSDYYENGAASPEKVELGRLLFFDKILSGNLNISCATCHHPLAGTGDGLSLPSGEGGRGLGVTRDTGEGASAIHERVPRNAPPVFNLGAREFTTLFHDGRVAADAGLPGGFLSPAGAALPPGLDNALAVQAMFPVTSGAEMAGQARENKQGKAAAEGDLGEVWSLIAQKLAGIEAYVDLFRAAYPGEVQEGEDISYVHAANAIAAFEATAWRFDDSPFDRFLRGDPHAMGKHAADGMKLFYGKARCAGCHAGSFQTDHDFHAIAMPQIGPGKGDNQPGYADGHDDFGRERVTGDPADRFRFRTPTLRNVVLTPPYGHAGAYDTLEAVVRHHLDARNALFDYDAEQATLPPRPDLDEQDLVVQGDWDRLAAIAAASELAVTPLRDQEVEALLAFLHALTDPRALDLRGDVPERVPSGLPVFD